jgi:hypothetical protein
MKESKKLMIGFGIVGVLCLCAAGVAYFAFRQFSERVNNFVEGDPTSIAKSQEEIAKFDVPPGYKPMAMSFLNYSMVSLFPEDISSGVSIMMIQYTGMTAASQEQIEEQLRQTAEQQSSQPGVSMNVVDTYEEVIRGETVTVTVSEGNYENFIMRQWMTIFTGNKGPTILMIQGPTFLWDDQFVKDFIGSIE